MEDKSLYPFVFTMSARGTGKTAVQKAFFDKEVLRRVEQNCRLVNVAGKYFRLRVSEFDIILSKEEYDMLKERKYGQ